MRKDSTNGHKRLKKETKDSTRHKRLNKVTQMTQQRDNFAKGEKCPPKVKTVHQCLEKSQMKKHSGFATRA